MSWRKWLKRKPPKRRVGEDRKPESGLPAEAYAPLRELIFADESLEQVAGFVAQQVRAGEDVRPLWKRLAQVAAWVSKGQRPLAVEELRRLLEDEGEDARSFFQFWNYLRQLGEVPGPAVATRILGLVVEYSREGRPAFLAAYWDGTARLLEANGEFQGFTNPDALMVDNVREFLAVCGPLVEATRPSPGPRPAPPVGERCLITVLTPAGLRSREGTWAALWDDAVSGPVLDMAAELRQRLLEYALGPAAGGAAPWPGRRSQGGAGGPPVQ
ncbi:hypothetical protein ACLESD_26275 [Pyxidicoccus sp. 3LFB2]